MPIQGNPLFDQLTAVLQRAETLVANEIPKSRKNISVGELDIAIRMVDMLNGAGIYSLWDLIRVRISTIERWRSFNSSPHRMSELIDAIDQAIKVLTGEKQLQKHEAEGQT